MIQKNFIELLRNAENNKKVNDIEPSILLENIIKNTPQISLKYIDISGKTSVCTDPRCEHQGSPQPIENFSKDKSRKCGVCSKCDKFVHSLPGCRTADLRCKK